MMMMCDRLNARKRLCESVFAAAMIAAEEAEEEDKGKEGGEKRV